MSWEEEVTKNKRLCAYGRMTSAKSNQKPKCKVAKMIRTFQSSLSWEFSNRRDSHVGEDKAGLNHVIRAQGPFMGHCSVSP